MGRQPSIRSARCRRRVGVVALVSLALLTPALAPSAEAEPLDEPGAGWCPVPRPPADTWLFRRGYGAGEPGEAGRAMTSRAAEEDARQRLIDSVRKAVTPQELAEVEAHIDMTWRPVHYDPARGEACAVAVLATKHLGKGLRSDSESLDARLAAVAKAAVALPKVRPPLWIDPPVWDDGRPTEGAGHALVMRMTGALAAAEVALAVKPAGPVLSGTLGPDPLGCRFQPWLARSKGKRVPLGAIVFPARALGLVTCAHPTDAFTADARLGIAGEQAGAGGLRVRLRAASWSGMLCEGVPFELTVEPTAPAWVQLFSVADDGQVLAWFEPMRLDGPYTPTPWPVEVLLRGELRSRIVAVAVPERRGKKALRGGPPPGCLARPGTGLDVRRFGEGVAVGSLPLGLWAVGQGQCPGDAETRKRADRYRAAVEALPACK